MKCKKWNRYLKKYAEDSETRQLVFVKYKGGSRADVYLYTKNSDQTWKMQLMCEGRIGKYGIGKVREGDWKTPVGVYHLTGAFGILENPGALMDYTLVNEYLYLSDSREQYNRLIDSRECPCGACGEHLIEYAPQYNYGFFLDHNKECIYGKGSAIFFHCTGEAPYTAGCIAVSEENMKKFLLAAEPGSRICIGKK